MKKRPARNTQPKTVSPQRNVSLVLREMWNTISCTSSLYWAFREENREREKVLKEITTEMAMYFKTLIYISSRLRAKQVTFWLETM